MGFPDDVAKLRLRLVEAVKLGVVGEESKDVVQAMLLQIMGEAERQRQQEVSAAQRLREQALASEAKAGAYAAISSLVYSIIDSYCKKAEQMEEEERELKKDREAGGVSEKEPAPAGSAASSSDSASVFSEGEAKSTSTSQDDGGGKTKGRGSQTRSR